MKRPSYGAEAGGDPADGLDEGGFFFLYLVAVVVVAGEGKNAGVVLFWGVCVAGCGAKPHDLDDSSGPLDIGETVVSPRCSSLCHLKVLSTAHRLFDATREEIGKLAMLCR